MRAGWVRIRARIHLLTTEQGGRAAPIVGGFSYRPNHNFFEPDAPDMSMGFMGLPEGVNLYPGESVDLDLALSIWPALTPEIRVGREWRIQEGSRLVGTGTILEIRD